MKKVLRIIVILILLVSVSSCNPSQQTGRETEAANSTDLVGTAEATPTHEGDLASPTPTESDCFPLLGIENKIEILNGIDEIYYGFIEEYIAGVTITDENKGVINLSIELDGIDEDALSEAVDENLGDLLNPENNVPNDICEYEILQEDNTVWLNYSFAKSQMDGLKTPEYYYELLADELPQMPDNIIIDTIAIGYTSEYTDLTFHIMYWDVPENTAKEYMESLSEFNKIKYDEFRYHAFAKTMSGLDLFVEFAGNMVNTYLIWAQPDGTSVGDAFLLDNPYTLLDEDIIREFIQDPEGTIPFTKTGQKILDIIGYNGKGISLSISESSEMVELTPNGDGFDVDFTDVKNCVTIRMYDIDRNTIPDAKDAFIAAFPDSYFVDHAESDQFGCVRNGEYAVEFRPGETMESCSFEADSESYDEVAGFIAALQFDEFLQIPESFAYIDGSTTKTAGIVPDDEGGLMLLLEVEFSVPLDDRDRAIQYYTDYLKNRFGEVERLEVGNGQRYEETSDVLLLQSGDDSASYGVAVAELNRNTLIVLTVCAEYEHGG